MEVEELIQLSLLWICFIIVVGFIIVVLSSKPMEHKYKVPYEDAKKFEAIGKTDEAIWKYKETIYHLENDYKQEKMWKGDDRIFSKQRLKMIEQMKEKVVQLEEGKGS